MILGAICLLAVVCADAASSGSGASAGAGSSSSSFSGVNGQGVGVNSGSTNGYTGTSTYGSGYPHTTFSTQQFSTQSSPNSNYPNNFNLPSQNFQNSNQFSNQVPNKFPNQFPNQFSNQYQNQFPNQFQNQFPNQFQNQFPNQYQNQFPNQFQNPFYVQQAQFHNQFQNQLLQQQQQFPFVPFVPIQFPPFLPAPFTPPEHQQFFNQFQNSLKQQIASGGSFAYSTPGSSAYALSSLGPANLYRQQQEALTQWQNGGGNANSVPFYAPSYAAATALYGNNGIHQTASIHPANPNSPNIDTRFGASGPSDGNGFFGVSTSSFSSSSDVNGVKTNRKGAITSVNDNGKITTYKVGS